MSLGVRSFLAVPIRIGTDIIGFISVDQVVSRRFWHHDEVRILTIAASLFSEYVQRGSIKSMLESSTIKLDNTLSSVEAVVSSLFHEIQTPLVTLSSYALEVEKALEAGDAETVSEYC
jgi:signal transduction protein with GAF and PtsI domain